MGANLNAKPNPKQKPRPGKILALIDTFAHYAFKLMIETLKDEAKRDRTFPETLIFNELALLADTGIVPNDIATIALCVNDEYSFETLRSLHLFLSQNQLLMNYRVLVFDFMSTEQHRVELYQLGHQTGFSVVSVHGQSSKMQRLRLERETKSFHALKAPSGPNEFQSYLGRSKQLPADFRFKWHPSLSQVLYDPWLVPSGQFLFLEQDRWIITLLGPTDIAGKWRKLGADPKSNENWWVWMPRKKQDSESGKWLFRGLKPQFQYDQWILVAHQPELVYLDQKKIRTVRLKKSEKSTFEIAQNLTATEVQFPEVIKAINTSIGSKDYNENNGDVFKKLNDVEEISHILETASKNQKEVLIWFKGTSERCKAKVIAHSQTNGKDLILIESEEPLDKFAGDIQAKIMGNFNLRRGAVFFNLSGAVAQGPNRLAIKPDRVFFEVQRRRSPRIPVLPDMPIKALLNQSLRVVKDISVGGACLYLIDREEASSLVTGQLCGLQLEVGTKTLHIKSYVRWVRDLNGLPAVGLEFFDVPESSASFLQTALFELASNDLDTD